MKINVTCPIGMALLGALCLATGVQAQDLTPKEREQAQHYLWETRDGVVRATAGLTQAQWNFKPAADRWSVAEVVEHLALIEDLVKGVLEKIDQAPAGAPGRDVQQVDAMLLARIPDRYTKAKAPPAAVPTGRWTPAEALEHYLAARNDVAEMLRTKPDLRQHVVVHPALGPLDGYQWVLTVAAHSARHTKQILEVKADPNFPAK